MPTASWSDLEWLASYGLPVVVEGLLTAEDPALAWERSAAAVVVVSNHGESSTASRPVTVRSQLNDSGLTVAVL